MALPALVLVHGGAHAGDCWDLTVDEIHRLSPELRVLAVDLPGRRGKPRVLSAVTITDCVESVITDVEDAGLGEVVVCGHSPGGVTVPGVVAKLGPSRVRAGSGRDATGPGKVGSELPDDVSWTWILTGRDRSLSQRQQRRSISALRGGGAVIPIDTCHDLMVSEPKRLAEILVERCRLYSR